MGHKSLKVPLRLFTIAGSAESDDPDFPGTQVLCDTLDDPILAGRVTSFHNDQNLQAVVNDVPVQLDELDLQGSKRALI